MAEESYKYAKERFELSKINKKMIEIMELWNIDREKKYDIINKKMEKYRLWRYMDVLQKKKEVKLSTVL